MTGPGVASIGLPQLALLLVAILVLWSALRPRGLRQVRPIREMWKYLTSVLIAGVIIPIVLHMIAPDRMPWWPDTVTLGVAFGFAAIVVAAKHGAHPHLWNALRNRRW